MRSLLAVLLALAFAATTIVAGDKGKDAAKAKPAKNKPADDVVKDGGAPEQQEEPKPQRMVGFADDRVQQAIEKACTYLWSQQKGDGSWPGQGGYVDGPSALACYAMLAAGVNPNEKRTERALDWLSKQTSEKTYCLGLRCNVWMLADKRTGGKYSKNLRDEMTCLIRSTKDGSYSYVSKGDGASSGDHSNSQFGVLGVWAGEMGTGEVPLQYWRMVMNHWLNAQTTDGGWSYRGGGEKAGAAKGGHSAASNTMTAAGLATVFVCFDRLYADQFLACEGKGDFAPLRKGLDWMDNFYARGGKGGNRSYYFLYALERVGLASGYKYFGKTDWYKVGCESLLSSQGAEGSWKDVVNTSFALLFLVRGQHPVAFNKLEHDGDWNNRPRDMAGLTRWQSTALERTLNWQIITLKSSVEEWHDAPVLYISGARDPKFTDEQIEKLRRYVWQGGTILSVTGCGGKGFSDGIRRAYEKMFPGLRLVNVPPDHELYSLEFRLGGRPTLHMIHNGIRPLVVHTDTDLTRSWQLQMNKTDPVAFEAGTNLLMYVTDCGQFRSRGVSHWPPAATAKPARTVTLARVKHEGSWDPEPLAYERFSRLMASECGIGVQVLPGVEAGQLAASGAGVATMTGTGAVNFTAEQKADLKKFVEGGGTLVIDAAGGDGAFAESATALLRELFGTRSTRLIQPMADVYSQKGMEIEKVMYRRKARALMGGSHNPLLRGVTIGGRVAVFYSKEDLTGGLVGCPSGSVVGYTPESCFRLLRNIVAYSLQGQKKPEAEKPAKTAGNPPPAAPAEAPTKGRHKH